MDKWNLFLRNRRIPDFRFEEDCFNFVRDLRQRWDGNVGKFLASETFAPRNTQKPPRIEMCIISCPARDAVLQRTLASLRASDWADQPVHIQIDSSSNPSPQVRQTETALAALQSVLRTAATHIVFLEDDVIFNRHIAHNLANWSPIVNGFAVFASLYNPGLRPQACSFRENFSLCSPESCFGSQAFVIARDALKYIIAHWNEVDGMQDIRISRLAARLQSPMFYHSPSLVQHVGRESTWGGGFHEARDFDEHWKTTCGAGLS